MLNLFLTNLVNFGLNQNLLVNTGYGALLIGREKKYRLFRYINILFMLLGIIICSIATYFLSNFVLEKFDYVELKVGFVVFLAGIYNLLISFLWARMSNFGQYLYEKSCSYVFDLVFTVFVVLTLDLSLSFVAFLLTLLSVLLVVFVSYVVLGIYIESINKSTLKISVRNVAARIYLIAIFAILLFYLSKLIWGECYV